jgi:hypothetical protein
MEHDVLAWLRKCLRPYGISYPKPRIADIVHYYSDYKKGLARSKLDLFSLAAFASKQKELLLFFFFFFFCIVCSRECLFFPFCITYMLYGFQEEQRLLS